MCTVRVILRQLLALPCKLLSRPSTADIVKYTLHIRRVMSEEEGDVPVTWSDFEKLANIRNISDRRKGIEPKTGAGQEAGGSE